MAENVLGVNQGGTGATTLTDNGVLIGNGTGAVDVTAAGTTGQVLTAVTGGNPTFQDASLPSSFVGKTIAKYKTADETVISSTALQDDDVLSFAIGANEAWALRIELHINANASGGFKFAFTLPSGASGRASWTLGGGMGSSADADITAGGGGTGAGTLTAFYIICGNVINSTNAGTVQLRWAQNASFGTGTTVAKNTLLVATRIS